MPWLGVKFWFGGHVCVAWLMPDLLCEMMSGRTRPPADDCRLRPTVTPSVTGPTGPVGALGLARDVECGSIISVFGLLIR